MDKALSLLLADKTQDGDDMELDIISIARIALEVYKAFDEVLMRWCPQDRVLQWGGLKFVSRPHFFSLEICNFGDLLVVLAFAAIR